MLTFHNKYTKNFFYLLSQFPRKCCVKKGKKNKTFNNSKRNLLIVVGEAVTMIFCLILKGRKLQGLQMQRYGK